MGVFFFLSLYPFYISFNTLSFYFQPTNLVTGTIISKQINKGNQSVVYEYQLEEKVYKGSSMEILILTKIKSDRVLIRYKLGDPNKSIINNLILPIFLGWLLIAIFFILPCLLILLSTFSRNTKDGKILFPF
jgi:hypothetical protein